MKNHNYKIHLFGQDMHYIAFLISLAVFLVVAYIVKRLLNRSANKQIKKGRLWIGAFLSSLFYPLLVIVALIVGYNIIMHCLLLLKLVKEWGNRVLLMTRASVVVVLTWFLLSAKNKAKALFLKQPDITPAKRAAVHALTKIMTVGVIIVSAITVMGVLNIKITALLTVGGVGAAAFAFASKDVIGNFFGGMMLYVTTPFREGDSITCSNKDIAGSVEEIGWYLTVIRNVSKQPIYVPNSFFTGSYVINTSRMSHRRLELTLGLRYQDLHKVKTVIDNVKNMLNQNDKLDQTLGNTVTLSAFADSSINIDMVCFTRQTAIADFNALKQEVYLAVADIVEQAGADFAFPTQTLDLPAGLHLNQ